MFNQSIAFTAPNSSSHENLNSPKIGMSPAHSKDMLKSPMGKAGISIMNYQSAMRNQNLPPAG